MALDRNATGYRGTFSDTVMLKLYVCTEYTLRQPLVTLVSTDAARSGGS